MTKNLTVKKGYGAYLKNRFGQESLNLTGTTQAVGFPLLGVDWFVEQAKVAASPKYISLNGDDKTFDISLEHKLIGFTFGKSENWEYAIGYGQDTLNRNIEGYQSTSITVLNLSSNRLAGASTNQGNHYMAQAMYKFFGENLTGETGLRYDKGTIVIPKDDLRPGTNSTGVPEESELDLTGFDFLLTLVYRF